LETYSDFGIKARAIMLQKGITIRALAKQLSISDYYLHEILKGTRPGKKQRPEIVKILGM
jgi:transcriptional regulator with XRE-family HTH domain